MLFETLNNLKGTYTICAQGKFPERILNIASTKGIYIHSVKKTEQDTLLFSVSKKGADILTKTEVEGLSVSVVEKVGIPVFFNRYKKRIALILLPAIFLIFTFIFSLFVWQVKITGADKELHAKVRQILSENGVRPGALKNNLDQYDIKRRSIIAIDDLAWLWVDIKGTTAYVNVKKRTDVPDVFQIDEPADVISTHSGVIEKLNVYCGIPLFSEGMMVEKGQIVVSGVLKSENENIPSYYRHACADLTLRTTEKKTYLIPQKTYNKKRTGNKKTAFGIIFQKNNVKFSLNSGISYMNYDKIEKTFKIPFLPVEFFKTTYHETNVSETAADKASVVAEYRKDFMETLRNMDVLTLREDYYKTSDGEKVTFTAEGLIQAGKEIPIQKGD